MARNSSGKKSMTVAASGVDRRWGVRVPGRRSPLGIEAWFPTRFDVTAKAGSHATMEAIVMTTASSAVVPEPVAVTPELLAQHSITADEYDRFWRHSDAFLRSRNWASTA